MGKREFLQLAHDHETKHNIAGWWMSHKLDGQRCFWDSGITRGLPTGEVPFANVAKDARYVDTPIATGLWSRYGKAIQAPDWWVADLPKVPLDMELYLGRGGHQELRTIVAKIVPDERWERVTGEVIDSPCLRDVFSDGDIRNANWETSFYSRLLYPWIEQRGGILGSTELFKDTYARLRAMRLPDWVHVLEQTPLSKDGFEADRQVRDELLRVTHPAQGKPGEGLVVRDPNGVWVPKRSRDLLKVKPENDAEGTVVGFTYGRETDKGSRHLGRMGALILDLFPGEPRGAPMTKRRLELSGFSDAERATVNHGDGYLTRAGQDALPGDGETVHFKIGDRVTFSYRELTNDGIPKEARFLRPRLPE